MVDESHWNHLPPLLAQAGPSPCSQAGEQAGEAEAALSSAVYLLNPTSEARKHLPPVRGWAEVHHGRNVS